MFFPIWQSPVPTGMIFGVVELAHHCHPDSSTVAQQGGPDAAVPDMTAKRNARKTTSLCIGFFVTVRYGYVKKWNGGWHHQVGVHPRISPRKKVLRLVPLNFIIAQTSITIPIQPVREFHEQAPTCKGSATFHDIATPASPLNLMTRTSSCTPTDSGRGRKKLGATS